jgi:hypothetical protein
MHGMVPLPYVTYAHHGQEQLARVPGQASPASWRPLQPTQRGLLRLLMGTS